MKEEQTFRAAATDILFGFGADLIINTAMSTGDTGVDEAVYKLVTLHQAAVKEEFQRGYEAGATEALRLTPLHKAELEAYANQRVVEVLEKVVILKPLTTVDLTLNLWAERIQAELNKARGSDG